MTNLRPTIKSDLDLIRRWIDCDPFHNEEKRHSAEWMLTPGGLLSFTLEDSEGSICFVRFDADVDLVRFATQFGPSEEVSKRRLITAMLSTGLPALYLFAKKNKYKGVVYESTSETLIRFMATQGFKRDKDNDYLLFFEEV